MTCREKLAIEHPKDVYDAYIGGCVGCPHAYGYAKKPEWCYPEEEKCTECWDREVEEVENGIKDGGEMGIGAGKCRCDLLPACVLLRVAEYYGTHDYEKKIGCECRELLNSALTHMFEYMDCWTDEDHLIAAIADLCFLAYIVEHGV